MKLIVGLGNPGKEYERSRHNVGFSVIDELAGRWSVEVSKRRHGGRMGVALREGEQVALLKPMTYMNESGQSVAVAAAFYRVLPQELMVVLDDMALELGQLRMRPQGSAGGHKGLQDVIAKLGHDDFGRLRVGIGAARAGAAVQHVLGEFGPGEREVMATAVARAATAVECWLRDGLERAMNEFNVRPGDGQESG